MWASAMAVNRIIKLGMSCDFLAHQIGHQLGAYTDCNHGCGLAVIQPVYYRYIYKYGLDKFVRFATNVWNISAEGKSTEKVALEGIEALENFIKEIGLPATLRELGIADKNMLSEIAESCNIAPGSYGNITHKMILKILNKCF